MTADAAHQPADVADDLGARRGLAGPQQHRHGAPGRGVVDMDRQEAAFAIVAVPERQLLRAVDHVDGVIDVERHVSGRCGVARAVEIDERAGQADQLARGGRILPPRWSLAAKPIGPPGSLPRPA